jgi:hypothetical protein
VVVCACHLSCAGNVNREITVQTNLGIKRDSSSKTTNAERTGSMAQTVEHLPSKSNALSSNSSTLKIQDFLNFYLFACLVSGPGG